MSAATHRQLEPGGGGAPLELGRQLGVALDRDHLVAGAGQVEGHPPGARPQLEDGAGSRPGELLPERQVGVVGAAFDVMPAIACGGGLTASLPVVTGQPSVREQGAQLQQGRVGGQGEEPAGRGRDGLVERLRDRALDRDRVLAASPRT